MIEIDLTKIGGLPHKGIFSQWMHSLEATCSFLSLSRGTWHINEASLWRHQYTHIHVRIQSPQNSMAIKHMCEQCVSGALSPSFAPGNETSTFLGFIVHYFIAPMHLHTHPVFIALNALVECTHTALTPTHTYTHIHTHPEFMQF